MMLAALFLISQATLQPASPIRPDTMSPALPGSMPTSQPASEPASMAAAPAPMSPIRFGLWLGPAVALGFRNERVSGSGQLFLEYWIGSYVGIRAAAGLGIMSTAFFMADLGATFDFLAEGMFIPYAEATVGLTGWLNNAVYPESTEGRATTAFSPAAGAGVRLFKTGTTYALGVHYRLLLDWLNATSQRAHGLLEIRLSLSFR